MSAFSETALETKLTELNPSQQSIQTLSLWLIHHRKHAKKIVATWKKLLVQIPQPKKLTFLYLANDVIQNSKKKGPEFSMEFEGVLPYAFHNVLKDADEKTRGSCLRLLTIWEERGVYSAGFIQAIKQTKDSSGGAGVDRGGVADSAAGAGGAKGRNEIVPILKKSRPADNNSSDENQNKKQPRKAKAPKSKGRSPEPDDDELKEKKKRKSKSSTSATEFPLDILRKDLEQDGKPEEEVKPPEPIDLVNALLELEASASNDEAIRAKIASYPPSIADVSLLKNLQNKSEGEKLKKQVDEASLLLAEYNGRLMAELEERKEVAQMLAAFMKQQLDKVAQAEKRLEDFKAKMEKVIKVRKELQSHIQNLPDLNLLPDVTTGGLAPLPSAEKLFN